jgi:hypothetical protein
MLSNDVIMFRKEWKDKEVYGEREASVGVQVKLKAQSDKFESKLGFHEQSALKLLPWCIQTWF